MKQVTITSGFWHDRLQINATRAIFHQWEQLEKSGCIENFRLAAGEVEGFREGWFFADSDAHKWLDAAARVYASHPNPRLAALMDEFIALLGRAQMPDGYLYTYNQIHFPKSRWENLQIEHELYCHGHLIEAGVSHTLATGREDLLAIACKAADRITADFQGKEPAYTPGHQEIEIALLRLHRVHPAGGAYLEMARQFIEQRGRIPGFGRHILGEFNRVRQREKHVQRQKAGYLAAHPDFQPYQMPPGNVSKKPPGATLRWYSSALRGQYFQQHAPVREQTTPVGHSVRFAYLETAIAMLAGESGDRSLLPALEQAWARMATRRMYVTGGVGSLPGLEGFGRDYELDPEFAYAETCAALASMFWSWEMALLTGEAKYSDLFEWQLYNAAGVGMGLDGTSYLYNNPLVCRGGVERKPWYAVPCCPSNLSRTWASLGEYLYSAAPGELRIHQYICSRIQAAVADTSGKDRQVDLSMESGLPWAGRVRITVDAVAPASAQDGEPFEILLRLPSWSDSLRARVNGETVIEQAVPAVGALETTASGYDPRPAVFLPLRRAWKAGDGIEIDLEMPLRLLQAHPKVKGHRGKVAVTRGPLVYCLESTDNPEVDLFTVQLDGSSLQPVYDDALLGGIVKIVGKAVGGAPLTFIPYCLWGNRGAAQMTVWVNG